MKKIVGLISLQIILLLFTGQAQQITRAGLEEAKKEIEASNKMYFQAFSKGDSSLFMNCYTNDCWIMQPNAPTLCGAEAPLDFFRTVYKNTGLRNGKFISIDIFGNGEGFVTEEGFWQFFDGNDKLIDNGKFLVLWQKTADGWKRFRDSFNSDRHK